ncbi:MAG: tRNA (adenosine(37)-N6)-threonylcarbamoyltransferase complex dimerization subunit type 1 TsaB [Armatimonadetes bacterium]|mgnify:CR=1 FL=1|jgi:tRNA threonylcarbamoyladenosine biosynthesis protein TsaB|nr:tRNA (adenosine(37)-N6)-threonylcarbamoyltransferase complex dimerization subunit type 1 TsaB [Armatimonadota bacterium]HOC30914.1 tRNA (adenosine(37)-N6)-threonylcarbamoyltransferase complex dimerization subunit type 1 TsaB [Armatimonadota bacterium]
MTGPLLALETTSAWCGIALWNDGGPVASHGFAQAMDLSSRLVPAVRDLLTEEGLTAEDLKGIAVSLGPGSFTGVRIGVATAKTLAQALDIPIAGVPTMTVLADPWLAVGLPLMVTIRARRGWYYIQKFQGDGTIDLVTNDQLMEMIQRTPDTLLVGDAVTHIEQPGCRVLPGSQRPDPLIVARIGYERLTAGDADDVMQLTPLYVGRSAAEERREGKRE